MHGYLLIDKPDGMTSHDVVNRVRRLTGEKRVGHAGTLDPFATGLLIVGVGRVATREFQKLVGLDKKYEAVFTFGATSDTDDRTGAVQSRFSGNTPVNKNELEAATRELTGPIQQIPPAYSAIKVGGKKLYELARAGKEVERKPRFVTVYAFDVLEGLEAHFRIHCSSGTYIRSLARDLGSILNVGGYVEELRRTAIGPFRIEESVPLTKLTQENVSDALLSIESVLSRLPSSARVNA